VVAGDPTSFRLTILCLLHSLLLAPVLFAFTPATRTHACLSCRARSQCHVPVPPLLQAQARQDIHTSPPYHPCLPQPPLALRAPGNVACAMLCHVVPCCVQHSPHAHLSAQWRAPGPPCGRAAGPAQLCSRQPAAAVLAVPDTCAIAPVPIAASRAPILPAELCNNAFSNPAPQMRGFESHQRTDAQPGGPTNR
jgi:hypothetical protein